jgi:hypothetical protein
MAKLSSVAKSKLDKLDDTSNGSNDPRSGSRTGNENKNLHFAPDEIAGLREQHRQYTKDIEAEAQSKDKKPQIDPNHAYPNFERSTTLLLSEIPVKLIENLLTFVPSWVTTSIRHQMRSIIAVCRDRLHFKKRASRAIYHAHRNERWRVYIHSGTNLGGCRHQYCQRCTGDSTETRDTASREGFYLLEMEDLPQPHRR